MNSLSFHNYELGKEVAIEDKNGRGGDRGQRSKNYFLIHSTMMAVH